MGGGGKLWTCCCFACFVGSLKTAVLPIFLGLSISNVLSFGRREVVGLLHIRNEGDSELFNGGAGEHMERRDR